MTRRKWQILAGVATWCLISLVAREVALAQSERVIGVLDPLGPGKVCGAAYLQRGRAAPLRPVGLSGTFVVPRGGSLLIATSSGILRAGVDVLRGDRVVRSREVLVHPGRPVRLRSDWFAIREESPVAPVPAGARCAPGSAHVTIEGARSR